MTHNALDDIHGGVDPVELDRLGLRLEEIVDFSANLNPFGPSPAVQRAARNAVIERYPDRTCQELRHALAERHHVADEQVLVGNGSSELIWLTAIGCLSAGDSVAVLGPTFSGYERAARLMRANVWTIDAAANDDFCPPFDAFARGIAARQPKLAFLASPNNPTGQSLALDDVFACATRNLHTLILLDEAYADCRIASRGLEAAIAAPANVLRVRSLTKAHGLAGVRLGYAVGDSEVIARLRDAQPPWSVNAVAQTAGLPAIKDDAFVRDTVARWMQAKIDLVNHLRDLRFESVNSEVPFFLLPVRSAAQTRSLLLRHGVVVRDCTSFGLPGHIRISARRPEENARLVSALMEIESARGGAR